MANRKTSPYGEFAKELGRRTSTSFKDPTFVLFVMMGVLLFGGLGIWSEVVKNLIGGLWKWDALMQALATYYPALIGAATIQLILEANRPDQRAFDRPMTIVAVVFLLLSIIIGILVRVFEANNTFSSFCFWATIALSIIGVWVWAIANCDNPDLKTEPTAASGGDTRRPLKGDMEGFEV